MMSLYIFERQKKYILLRFFIFFVFIFYFYKRRCMALLMKLWNQARSQMQNAAGCTELYICLYEQTVYFSIMGMHNNRHVRSFPAPIYYFVFTYRISKYNSRNGEEQRPPSSTNHAQYGRKDRE